MKKKSIFSAVIFLLSVLCLIIMLLHKKETNTRYTSVLCLGDSLTQSRYGNYPKHLQRLFLKNRMPVKVISAGRPGNTSGEYLDYLHRSDILIKTKPGFIIIMLGTNDVRIDSDHTEINDFMANINQIIDIIRNFSEKNRIASQIFLALPPPIFNPDLHTFNQNSALRIQREIVPGLRQIGREQELKIIDVYNFFIHNKQLLPGIHPSKLGYYKMALFIYQSILSEVVKMTGY